MRHLFRGLGLVLLMSNVAQAQEFILCNNTPLGPFTVNSGSPFTITWIMEDTVVENGITVPHRYNGFYLQIDGGPKTDVGLATKLTACSPTSQRPNDIPYTYLTPSGVSRGTHTLKISAWNFSLDGAGNPTTTKVEGPVATIPFAAGEPMMFGPPGTPLNIVIAGKGGPTDRK